MKSLLVVACLGVAAISIGQVPLTQLIPLSQTEHTMSTRTSSLTYSATAGHMPIYNQSSGEHDANMFHVSYLKKGADPRTRPVMFGFNGGPGSATVWLHMGCMGPKMTNFTASGDVATPPFKPVWNPETWLEFADIVCIDAVGAGLSRTVKPGERKFYGVQPDIEVFGEFIRMWLNKNNRWSSPLYVCGESYGGIRAGGLCKYLLDNGIALSGMVIVSGVMNYQAISFARGNDLAFATYLPTMAATAWYHKKLSPRLQRNLEATVKEVQEWVDSTYAPALHRGDSLSDTEKQAIARKLSEYTSLDQKYILLANLRVRDSYFYKELLRDERETVGRLDARIKGADASGITATPEYDASSAAMTPPYMSGIYDYLINDLKINTDMKYFTFGAVNPWDFGGGRSYPDTSEAFRSCLVQNPSMKVLFTYGYYDFACPFGSMQYTLNHMDLHPDRKKNLEFKIYPAGHMMYIEEGSRVQLAADVRSFVKRSSP